MKLSDLVTNLTAHVSEFGDTEVVVFDQMNLIEFEVKGVEVQDQPPGIYLQVEEK